MSLTSRHSSTAALRRAITAKVRSLPRPDANLAAMFELTAANRRLMRIQSMSRDNMWAAILTRMFDLSCVVTGRTTDMYGTANKSPGHVPGLIRESYSITFCS